MKLRSLFSWPALAAPGQLSAACGTPSPSASGAQPALAAAASASSRPAPHVLSTPGPPRSTAELNSALRRAVRSDAGLSPDSPRFRDGWHANTRAAIAPAWGAAADDPKNGVENPPAPLTDTPSMATASGFVRPSFVGPRLLYGAMSLLPGSLA